MITRYHKSPVQPDTTRYVPQGGVRGYQPNSAGWTCGNPVRRDSEVNRRSSVTTSKALVTTSKLRVTTSKAPVTTSKAPVTTSTALVTTSKALQSSTFGYGLWRNQRPILQPLRLQKIAPPHTSAANPRLPPRAVPPSCTAGGVCCWRPWPRRSASARRSCCRMC